MHLRDILNAKGNDVHTIAPAATLQQVVEKLVEENCGSLVVVEDEKMVGIITERDILRAIGQVPLEDAAVKDRMTREVITGRADQTVQQAMGTMTDHRIRHLPVLHEDGRLAGMISIGDVVKTQHDQLTMENHYLKNYINS